MSNKMAVQNRMTKKATKMTENFLQHLSVQQRREQVEGLKSHRSAISVANDVMAGLGDETLEMLEKFEARIQPHITRAIDRIE
jgi:hypothetical protein